MTKSLLPELKLTSANKYRARYYTSADIFLESITSNSSNMSPLNLTFLGARVINPTSINTKAPELYRNLHETYQTQFILKKSLTSQEINNERLAPNFINVILFQYSRFPRELSSWLFQAEKEPIIETISEAMSTYLKPFDYVKKPEQIKFQTRGNFAFPDITINQMACDCIGVNGEYDIFDAKNGSVYLSEHNLDNKFQIEAMMIGLAAINTLYLKSL